MLKPQLTVGKTGIAKEIFPADYPAETLPLFLSPDRDHTPAILALAAITAVGRRHRIAIAPRLRIMVIYRGIQIGHTKGIGGPFDLRQIDGYALSRSCGCAAARQP